MLSLTVNYNTAALCPILAVMLSAVLSYLIGRKSERARDIFASLVALGAAVYFGVSLFCKTGADAAFGMTEPTFCSENLAVQCAVCFHSLGNVVCDNGIFDTVFQDIR